jgi:hypothetical protein
LEIVSKLILNIGHLRNAGSNISVDGSSDLEEHVDSLTVEIKSSLVLLLVVG